MQYYGITKEAICEFRKLCYICNLKASQFSQPRLKPIILNKIFERCQIDLVDMRNKRDGEYRLIAHCMV